MDTLLPGSLGGGAGGREEGGASAEGSMAGAHHCGPPYSPP